MTSTTSPSYIRGRVHTVVLFKGKATEKSFYEAGLLELAGGKGRNFKQKPLISANLVRFQHEYEGNIPLLTRFQQPCEAK